MGGGYTDEYFYDHRYRLAQNLHSDGYTGNTDYRLWYSPTTRIGHKYSDNPDIGEPDLVYGYDVAGYTHQPRVVHDILSDQHVQLYWDKNGNLRQIQPNKSYPRFHMWDDDNQLLMSFGPTTCGYYGNASDGKRAYKLTGTCTISSVNGGEVTGAAYFENVTLYPNPYMTLTEDGYTKHYFMGADRIGTTIGGGNGGNWLVNPIDRQTSAEYNMSYNLKGLDYPYYYHGCYHYDQHYDHTTNTDYTGHVHDHTLDYANYQYIEDEATLGQASMMFNTHFADALAHYYLDNLGDKPYYYHSDHLGSAAWITDNSGLPVQYIMYAPYGEQLLNQLAGTYKERFTFTGKERDKETGYTHYDARKLSDIFGIWLTPDPLLDKYIYNSPYVYCNGNPIKFVDPDGEACQLSIRNNTITISAIYYAKQKDMKSAMNAVNFWNGQNNLQYTSKDGKTFSVKFNMIALQDKNPYNKADNNNIANVYEIVKDLGTNANGDKITGSTAGSKFIQVTKDNEFSTTGAHEVGHTLMNANSQAEEHSQSGIMTEYKNVPKRDGTVSEETIKTIVETNGFEQKSKSLWQSFLERIF